MVVYVALYAVIFGISFWLLAFHKDNPGNWFLYLAMVVSVLAGIVRFIQSRKKQVTQN